MAGFQFIDYLILAAYLAGVTFLGGRFASRQRNARDFFLAGRSMGWFPMVLSVIATDFSAISFLGAPGYVVAHDMVIDLQVLTFIWVLPLSFYLFVRFFHRLELISAYEYLERRFSLPLRTSCSLLFICVRTGWMATALYATGLALAQGDLLALLGLRRDHRSPYHRVLNSRRDARGDMDRRGAVFRLHRSDRRRRCYGRASRAHRGSPASGRRPALKATPAFSTSKAVSNLLRRRPS